MKNNIVSKNTFFTRKEAIDCVNDGVLIIPDHKISLEGDFAFFVVRSDLPKVHTLVIPASVIDIPTMRGDYSSGTYGYKNNPFSTIIVADGNPVFSSEDGVLFTKNMDTLLCYPCGRPDTEYHVPSKVKRIKEESFLNVEHLKEIYFTKNLTEIEERAFCACGSLDFPDLVTLYKKGNQYLLCIRDVGLYKKRDENECGYYACTLHEDEFDDSVQDVDEKYAICFINNGGGIVSDHDEKCRFMRRFRDAVCFGFGYDEEMTCSHSNIALDLNVFLNTFYSEYY